MIARNFSWVTPGVKGYLSLRKSLFTLPQTTTISNNGGVLLLAWWDTYMHPVISTGPGCLLKPAYFRQKSYLCIRNSWEMWRQRTGIIFNVSEWHRMKPPPPTHPPSPCVVSEILHFRLTESSFPLPVPSPPINHLLSGSLQLSSPSLLCTFSLDTLKFCWWFYNNEAFSHLSTEPPGYP